MLVEELKEFYESRHKFEMERYINDFPYLVKHDSSRTSDEVADWLMGNIDRDSWRYISNGILFRHNADALIFSLTF